LIDWDSAKRIALWNYEDLIAKMQKFLSYKFIEEYYSHNMEEAKTYAKKLLPDNKKHQKMLETLLSVFGKLEDIGIENYQDLVHRIEKREKCEQFLQQTGFSFGDLIFTLNYVFRWVLPFRNVSLKQLTNPKNKFNTEYLKN
jgi:hypothetical protein